MKKQILALLVCSRSCMGMIRYPAPATILLTRLTRYPIDFQWHEKASLRQVVDQVATVKLNFQKRWDILSYYALVATAACPDKIPGIYVVCFQEMRHVWHVLQYILSHNAPLKRCTKKQIRNILGKLLDHFEQVHALLIELRITWKSMESTPALAEYAFISRKYEVFFTDSLRTISAGSSLAHYFRRMRLAERYQLITKK